MKLSFLSKHPKEMYLLALCELCQRFAFWGIANLLVFYLVQHHHFLDMEADQLFGLFTGVAFVLPILGGWIADRTSHRRCVLYGALLNAISCLLLAIGSLPSLYIALAICALGGSIFTPGIYTILGHVYHDKHSLREGGFSLYYCSVNIGIFLAMIILGWIGQTQNWSLTFIVAAIVQLLGILPFLKVMKTMPPHTPDLPATASSKKRAPCLNKKQEKDRIIVICTLAFFSILFWLAFNQGGSSMNLFALRFTDRNLWGFEMPPSWLLSLESLYLVVLAFPLTALYIYLAKKKKDPSPPMKCSLGFFSMALCFLIMVLGSSKILPGASFGSLSPIYLMSAYFFMALGEMLISPIGLSLVTHLSPHRYTAMLVGVWYFCIGIGFYAGGFIAGWMMMLPSIASFFNIYVVLSCFGAFCLFILSHKLNKMRHIDHL